MRANMEKHNFKKFFFENFLHKAILAWWVGMFVFQLILLILAFQNVFSFKFFSSIMGCLASLHLINYFYNKYKPKHKWQLQALVHKQIKRYGSNCDLNHIDVSRITDMSILFYESEFNGDISKWDVSKVKDMSSMFYKCKFNGDISKWDVSKVKDMSFMFSETEFNGDISQWDVSSAITMSFMFNNSQFNGDITNWDVAKVENMEYMFYKSNFSGDITNWDVSKVEDMTAMFYSSKFKNPMFDFDPSNIQDDLMPLPYWAEFEDAVTRKNAIANRMLHKDLSAKLENSNKQSNKLKL